ncbi:MAG: glycosyltransferase, partial [Syntrophomonadaceae bacterium]|nr:glycosyltransferase [Syntrophomonadaceae bacterium]
FVQEQRGNRPIRQTKTFLSLNIPVFFSYWRWRKNEAIPVYPDKKLFQSPIDKTLAYLDEVIDFDYKAKKKLFIVSFPHPSITGYLERLKANHWLTVYDVRDDWEEFQKVGQAKWFDLETERLIVENSDVVCAVSGVLRDKMQALTGNKIVKLSPNALDSTFLKGGKAAISPRDGKPIIGYVGHLTDAWFDWPSLINIANIKPGWQFEIIGHFIPPNLNLPANILYLGPKNHSEIKKIAKKWRTAIIPFKIGNLSDSVDPIKVYEYLAMGLPVVSFRMPQIHGYPYVFIANNAEEFIMQIEKALHCPMDSHVIAEFLAVNRWEDRAKQFLEWSNLK